MKYSKYLIAGLMGLSTLSAAAQQPSDSPKLVVNIVVSQMRYDYLTRLADNFTDNGFKYFMLNGTNYTNARYNYMQTNTVAGLATITTGANPSTHGVISTRWLDYTTNNEIDLIEDYSVRGLECEVDSGRYSALNLTAATLGDRLRETDAASKVLSIAATPASAIVAGGPSADVFWLDAGRGNWISSSYYFDTLPSWVSQYNEKKTWTLFFDREWVPSKNLESYRNSDTTIISFQEERKFRFREFFRSLLKPFKKDEDDKFDPASLLYTPYGNTLTTDFVKEAIVRDELGKDDHTDLLTVCYDTPRLIGEHFGPRSIEVEDMYYKLDEEIAELLGFILAQFKTGEVVIVLTSDHGCSDTFRENSRIPMGQFNSDQFKMIMNGFLSAQYEPGSWVLDYSDRQLYLNRELIYQYGFNLEEVQTRAAAFALQFRGVAGALTGTSMQSGYFGKGYGEKIQNSFYPKRSGDLTINLMPGWIEERPGKVSLSGSLYEYDTHVPLLFLGGNIPSATVERSVDMTSVAPTLARLMRITVPNAATGEVLNEIVENR